jgi:Cof subfamily protein (haloacid dehalogenase superfamily)
MTFSQVKVAAFDMDGTLLNGDSKMTELTKEACRKLQASGCKLVLSTGRTFLSAQIPIDRFPFDGYVCSNGATVLEADGTLVKSTLLPREMILDVLHKLRKEPIYYELHDTASNRWMVREDRERIESLLAEDTSVEGLSLRRFSFYKLARVVELEDLLNQIASDQADMVKIFVWHREPSKLEQVRGLFEPWTHVATVTSSGHHNVEIIPKGVSKWEGLRYFCDKWGVAPEQVVAFGDADNDREILSRVGFPVAMDNASPAIKQLARFVAKHHNEDGVAKFILEQMLGNG